MRKVCTWNHIANQSVAIAAPIENQVVGVTYTEVLNIWGLCQRKSLLNLY